MATNNDDKRLPAKVERPWSYGEEIALNILASPNRNGLNFTQIAELAQISTKQLKRWRLSERFQREVTRRTMLAVNDALPEITSVLVDKARGGNLKAIELVLRSLHILSDNQVLVPVEGTTIRRTEEEIAQSIDELSRRLLDLDSDGDAINVDAEVKREPNDE